MSRRGTIIIIDDDAPMRDALEALLQAEDFETVCWASPEAFLDAPLPRPPACVLLDLNMPGLDGLEVQRALSRRSGLPVIFLSGAASIATTVAAMKGGAVEFLEKPVRPHLLLHAVNDALALSGELQAHHEDVKDAERRFATLTARQREVLILASKGLTNGAIAEALEITERTVKFHRQLAMQSMDVESITEFARLAEKAELG